MEHCTRSVTFQRAWSHVSPIPTRVKLSREFNIKECQTIVSDIYIPKWVSREVYHFNDYTFTDNGSYEKRSDLDGCVWVVCVDDEMTQHVWWGPASV